MKTVCMHSIGGYVTYARGGSTGGSCKVCSNYDSLVFVWICKDQVHAYFCLAYRNVDGVD